MTFADHVAHGDIDDIHARGEKQHDCMGLSAHIIGTAYSVHKYIEWIQLLENENYY